MGIGTLMVLGGALSGAGAGIARQGEMDRQHAQTMERVSADQKFQETLENLRSKNQREGQAAQSDLMDRNNARQTVRETDQSITVANNNTANQAKLNNQEFDQKLKLTQIDFANDKEMAKLQGDIQRGNNAAAARLSQELQNGEVTQIFEGGDGVYYKMTRSGQIQSTGVPIAPKETKSAGSGSIAEIRAQRGGGEPTKAAPKPAPKGNTYTQADAAATAKKHGVSVEEVHQRMRAAGYKLTAG